MNLSSNNQNGHSLNSVSIAIREEQTKTGDLPPIEVDDVAGLPIRIKAPSP
jgi:hypothetical protein